MNKERRKAIEKIIDSLDQLMAEIDTVASEEREYYDNMPENMQMSERGEKASQDADALEQARDDVETAKDSLFGVLE